MGLGTGAGAGESGRETPTALRRALQRLPLRSTVGLSPTKRRKQTHGEEPAAGPSSPLKQPACGAREVASPASLRSGRAEGLPPAALPEILAQLGVKDIVERAGPVAKAWQQAAHGQELWDILTPRVHILDRLIVSEKIVERRSKGKLFRGRIVGIEGPALVRIVDLELTNAGKDDGVPTSLLRETALLSKVRHPNIVRFLGSEIQGKQAVVCTEFMHENFSLWFKRLEFGDRLGEIRGKFSQLLVGLSHLHHQGIMHRNLKPDNLFVDEHGTVKIGDFTTTRMLDVPLIAYTPEDPKERDRSGREVRRLWYRAPELLLREEIYGPKVDTWAIGCLLAEAAAGKPLLPSDSEIDHLFRIFRLVGTPTPATWPELLTMKSFSPKFPLYTGFDFAQVAQAACCGNVAEEDVLVAAAAPDRTGELQLLLSAANALGPNGMHALSAMLVAPPAARATVDELLQLPFFAQPDSRLHMNAATASWLEAGATATTRRAPLGFAPRPSNTAAAAPAPITDGGPPALPARCSASLSSEAAWNMLQSMQGREDADDCIPGGSGCLLPAEYAEQRSRLLDITIGMAGTLALNDNTLHLGVRLIDARFCYGDVAPGGALERAIISACLKIADVFCEQSKEYYKQENVSEYAEAVGNGVTATQILRCEKEFLPKLNFDLRLPTVAWFLHCFLAYSDLQAGGRVGRVASFIGDLTLLDDELLAYTHSLRALCVLVVAAFTASSQAPGGQAIVDQASDSARLSLPALETWDQRVRDRACSRHSAVEGSMCLRALVHTLVVKRREWKNARLTAIESKHGVLATTLAYPERFPVTKLVRYILPDSQQGLLPE